MHLELTKVFEVIKIYWDTLHICTYYTNPDIYLIPHCDVKILIFINTVQFIE